MVSNCGEFAIIKIRIVFLCCYHCHLVFSYYIPTLGVLCANIQRFIERKKLFAKKFSDELHKIIVL